MKNMMFLQGDAGGGTGGGGETAPPSAPTSDGGELSRGGQAFEPVTKTSTGEPPLPKPKPASPGPSEAETKPTVETSTMGGFDAEKFAKSFGTELGTTLKPILEKASPQEKMSPEEAKQYLKIWEPDDSWYARYDNLETRKDAVNEMRDGLVTQADTLNKLRMEEALDNLRKEFMPHIEAAQRIAEEHRETRLHTKYPMLAKPEIKPLVNAITQDFVKNGRKFDSEAELFKALANGVEAVLKINNPEYKLEEAGADNGASVSQGRSGNQLPVTTPGGGGSTGRRETAPKTDKPRGLAIFGK